MSDKCMNANGMGTAQIGKMAWMELDLLFHNFQTGGQHFFFLWAGRFSLFGITGRRYRRIGCGGCRCLFIIFGVCATHTRYQIFNGPWYTTQCNAECLGMNAQWIATTFITNQTCNVNMKLFITYIRVFLFTLIRTDQWTKAGYKNTFANHMPAESCWKLLQRTILWYSQCEIAERHTTEETANEQPQHQLVVFSLFGHYWNRNEKQLKEINIFLSICFHWCNLLERVIPTKRIDTKKMSRFFTSNRSKNGGRTIRAAMSEMAVIDRQEATSAFE